LRQTRHPLQPQNQSQRDYHLANIAASRRISISPRPEPEIVYVETEEVIGRLGYRDFKPKLFAEPLRWFD
jgi:hypothetical protein